MLHVYELQCCDVIHYKNIVVPIRFATWTANEKKIPYFPIIGRQRSPAMVSCYWSDSPWKLVHLVTSYEDNICPLYAFRVHWLSLRRNSGSVHHGTFILITYTGCEYGLCQLRVFCPEGNRKMKRVGGLSEVSSSQSQSIQLFEGGKVLCKVQSNALRSNHRVGILQCETQISSSMWVHFRLKQTNGSLPFPYAANKWKLPFSVSPVSRLQ